MARPVPGLGDRPAVFLHAVRPREPRDHRRCGLILRGGSSAGRPDPAQTRNLAHRFNALFPAADFEVAYAWAGTFGETEDGLAYIGHSPERPDDYFALGYGGNGITMSVIAARLIADDFLGRPNPDAHIFRFGR